MSAQLTVPHGRQVGSKERAITLLSAGGPANDLLTNVLLWAGAALMVWSSIIHFHLWSTSYRHIPTIGPLFIMQVIVGIVLAVVLAVFRRVWTALVAFGFVASTIGGFLLSVNVGLFGFQDSWSAPFAGMAFAVEVSALVLLAAGGGLCLLRSWPGRRTGPPTSPSNPG